MNLVIFFLISKYAFIFHKETYGMHCAVKIINSEAIF